MNKYHCTDAGRDGCPCQLGVYGKCLVCPRIGNSAAIPQGCNDCGWQGTCISTLFHQSLQQPASVRFEQSLLIEDVKPYGADLKVFLVRADRGFCQRAKASGTYVFLRWEGRDKWFDMPISILKSEPEKNLIHLAICGEGPKSRDASAAESGQHFIVRGIFTGGLTGLTEMAARSASTEVMLPVVVFAKGIAIAPLRNLLDDPCSGITTDDLRLYVDLEKTGWDFFYDYFGDIPVSAVHIEDFREDGLAVSGESFRKKDVLALTSPYYADLIETAARRGIVKPQRARLCCGEGVCGACSMDDENGQTVHQCKSLLNPHSNPHSDVLAT